MLKFVGTQQETTATRAGTWNASEASRKDAGLGVQAAEECAQSPRGSGSFVKTFS